MIAQLSVKMLSIIDYSTPYILSLFDYDPVGNDENMAAESFFIYSNDNGFPNTLSILDSNEPIAVNLEVNYER